MGVTLPTRVNGGTLVLLLTDRRSGTVDEACVQLLSGDEASRRTVVAVTVDGSAEAFVDAWFEHASGKRTDLNVVDVGTNMRSVTAEPDDATTSANVIRGVADVRDLDSVRTQLEQCLTEPVGPSQTGVVYLDSVTALLEQVGPRATFDFLADVRDLVEMTEFVAFVRAVHQAQRRYPIDVLRSLFDVTLTFGPDEGAWSVRSQPTAIDDASGPGIDDLFKLLSVRRRRLVLHFLRAADGPMATAELATRIAAAPTGGDEDDGREMERIHTGLVHVQLPMLEDYGVVSVEAGGDEIRLGPTAERLEPLLALTMRNDLLR